MIMLLARSDIAFGDWHAVKQQLDKAKKLCDEGGDWERKNRLKVYEALFMMVTRDFKKAGELFLDSTATFGAYVSATTACLAAVTPVIAHVCARFMTHVHVCIATPDYGQAIMCVDNDDCAAYASSMYHCQGPNTHLLDCLILPDSVTQCYVKVW